MANQSDSLERKKMIDMDEFNTKIKQQSHSFIFFEQGPPYCELGWKGYKRFNSLISEAIREFKEESGKDVYVYEHEIILVEALFLWGFSFFETDPMKRDGLSRCLIKKINSVMLQFRELIERPIINNHDNNFSLDPCWAEHYMGLIDGADIDLDHKYCPPKEKSYEKEELDLGQFIKSLTVEEFKTIINKYRSTSSSEDIMYLLAEDGFFSNKYRSNKYLREEFIPLMYFLEKRKIPNSAEIKLGIQNEIFDAKITDTETDQEIIIEITMGTPKNDHLLFSIFNQSRLGMVPLKTMAYLKKERDSLPGRIIEAIEKKHKKNYQDQRILMVVVQSEYTYQNEDYVISEIIKEVCETVGLSKGNFQEIIMVCGAKIYDIF